MSERPTENADLTPTQARRRAVDLLEQAFATQTVPVGDPWASAPEIRSVLPESERLLYIEAAKAYATLALTAPPAGEGERDA